MDEKRVIECVFSAKGWAPPHNLRHAVACAQEAQQGADSCALARIEQPYHVSPITRSGGIGDAPGIERGCPPASPAASRCTSVAWRIPCNSQHRPASTRIVNRTDRSAQRRLATPCAVGFIGTTSAPNPAQLSLRKATIRHRQEDRRHRALLPLRRAVLSRGAATAQGRRLRRRSSSLCSCSWRSCFEPATHSSAT